MLSGNFFISALSLRYSHLYVTVISVNITEGSWDRILLRSPGWLGWPLGPSLQYCGCRYTPAGPKGLSFFCCLVRAHWMWAKGLISHALLQIIHPLLQNLRLHWQSHTWQWPTEICVRCLWQDGAQWLSGWSHGQNSCFLWQNHWPPAVRSGPCLHHLKEATLVQTSCLPFPVSTPPFLGKSPDTSFSE